MFLSSTSRLIFLTLSLYPPLGPLSSLVTPPRTLSYSFFCLLPPPSPQRPKTTSPSSSRPPLCFPSTPFLRHNPFRVQIPRRGEMHQLRSWQKDNITHSMRDVQAELWHACVAFCTRRLKDDGISIAVIPIQVRHNSLP